MPLPPRRLALFLLLASLAGVPVSQAEEKCETVRERLGQQMQQARLEGDTLRLTGLERQLAALNRRCLGMIALQRNSQRVEAASRRVSAAEAALREALGRNDSLAIGGAQRRLDAAREDLEEARRGG